MSRRVLGHAETPIVPASIASLAVWLKPDDLNGSLNDADPVASWTDAKTGLVFAQATSGKRPTLRKNARNGHSVVRFDGSDDVLTVSSALMDVTSRTIILAWLSRIADITVVNTICGLANTGWMVGASTTERVLAQYRNTAGTLQSPAGTLGVQFSTSQWTLATYITSTSGSNVRSTLRNKSAIRYDVTDAGGHQAVTNTTICVGGQGTTPSNPANGDLAELLMFTAALDVPTVLAVERYLAARFLITVP